MFPYYNYSQCYKNTLHYSYPSVFPTLNGKHNLVLKHITCGTGNETYYVSLTSTYITEQSYLFYYLLY